MPQSNYLSRKWKREGLEVESIVKRYQPKIEIYEDGRSNKVVVVVDRAWATQWLDYYEIDIPHHAQPVKRKISFL